MLQTLLGYFTSICATIDGHATTTLPLVFMYSGVCSLGIVGTSACLQDDSIAIKERYLGLHMPHEMQALQAHLAKLADLVEANLDMEQIFLTAETAQVPRLPPKPRASRHLQNGRQHVRIGVAKDGAFSFYYNE